MHRAALLLLASVVFLATPAAASQHTESSSAFVLGDSLALGTLPHLAAQLPGWSVTRHAAVGYRTADGVRHVRALGGRLPGHLVLSLGTNDDPRRVEQFGRAVRELLSLARDRCLIWANIVRPPVGGVSYDGYNRALGDEARRHRRLRVVDWRAMTRAHPEWLRRDGVHATAAGYRARATASIRALTACRQA